MKTFGDYKQGGLLETPILLQIEEVAQAMTRREILDLLGVTEDQLSPVDKQNFSLACLKGKSQLVRFATEQLKGQMRGKQGVTACLAALSRFGEAWESPESIAGAKSFKISFDE